MRASAVYNNGFTVVELMVALVVAGILMTVGVPAFTDIVKNNRLLAETYALRAVLNQARSKALSERTFTTVCASVDSEPKDGKPDGCGGEWHGGYVAFTDNLDGNGIFEEAKDDQYLVYRELQLASDIAIVIVGTDRFTFDSRGHARNRNGTLIFCDSRGAKDARALVIAATGAVSSAMDTDDNGILNDPSNGGLDIACD